jgi:voltage-gated potassium channel Kch
MLTFLIALRQFWGASRRAWRDPDFQVLTTIMAIILLLGTAFYHTFEGWSLLDSLYFSVITLATVGYGDFSPKTAIGKLFTIFYIFMGFGLVVVLLTRFSDALIQSEHEAAERRRQRRTQSRQQQKLQTVSDGPGQAAANAAQEQAVTQQDTAS